jgi:hypothetical protein
MKIYLFSDNGSRVLFIKVFTLSDFCGSAKFMACFLNKAMSFLQLASFLALNRGGC